MPATLTATALAEALAVNQALADRLHPVAVAMVDRYAPAAPEAVANEAAIRFAGWLSEAPASGARREDIGDISTSFSPAMTGGFRASGAMALLSPWKVRRAGAVG